MKRLALLVSLLPFSAHAEMPAPPSASATFAGQLATMLAAQMETVEALQKENAALEAQLAAQHPADPPKEPPK